jgi:hypothetical protein
VGDICSTISSRVRHFSRFSRSGSTGLLALWDSAYPEVRIAVLRTAHLGHPRRERQGPLRDQCGSHPCAKDAQGWGTPGAGCAGGENLGHPPWANYHHRLWPVQPTTISPLDTKIPTLKPSDHPRTYRPAADFESNPLPVTTCVINAT